MAGVDWNDVGGFGSLDDDVFWNSGRDGSHQEEDEVALYDQQVQQDPGQQADAEQEEGVAALDDLAPPTRAAFAVLSSIYSASGGGEVGSGDDSGSDEDGSSSSSREGASSGDGGWMLDVGANVGFFTAHAAAAGMRVLSFAPQPDCLAMLHQSLTASGLQPSVRLIHAALGMRPSSSSAGTAGGTVGTAGIADNTTAPLLDRKLGGEFCLGRYLAQGGQVSGPDEVPRGRMHRGALSLLQSDAGGGVEDARRLPRPAAMPLSRFLETRHAQVLRLDVDGDEVQVLESGGEGGGAAATLHDLPDRCFQGRLPGGVVTVSALVVLGYYGDQMDTTVPVLPRLTLFTHRPTRSEWTSFL